MGTLNVKALKGRVFAVVEPLSSRKVDIVFVYNAAVIAIKPRPLIPNINYTDLETAQLLPVWECSWLGGG